LPQALLKALTGYFPVELPVEGINQAPLDTAIAAPDFATKADQQINSWAKRGFTNSQDILAQWQALRQLSPA